MQPLLNSALGVARMAGEIISRATEQVDLIDIDANGRTDFIHKVKTASEHCLINGLQKRYPGHSFHIKGADLIEGTGQEKNHIWVINPLNGSANFINGMPHFSVSLALKIKGQIEVAVILDPIRKEEFTAARGRGAQMNGRRLRVNSKRTLPEALLATSQPSNQDASIDKHINIFKTLASQCSGIRHCGTISLDLAYVAAGRFDGFWGIGLNEWDVSAGTLLIQEAGGLVGDTTGGMDHLSSGTMVCAQPKLFKSLIQTMQPPTKNTSI